MSFRNGLKGTTEQAKNVRCTDDCAGWTDLPVFSNTTRECPITEAIPTGEGLPPLSSVESPQVDLKDLTGARRTISLLREVGIIWRSAKESRVIRLCRSANSSIACQPGRKSGPSQFTLSVFRRCGTKPGDEQPLHLTRKEHKPDCHQPHHKSNAADPVHGCQAIDPDQEHCYANDDR